MTSYRTMKDLANDPAAVKGVAKSLLSLAASAKTDAVRTDGESAGPRSEWTDWEIDFLESLVAGRGAREALSMRQREKLAELMGAAERKKSIDGFSLGSLIEAAYGERFDLEQPDDISFIESLMTERKSAAARATGFTLSGRQAQRLKRCCRMLGLIDPDYAAA